MIPLLYERAPLPDYLPKDMERKIASLKKKHKTQKAFLKAAYDHLVGLQVPSRVGTFIHFFDLWNWLPHNIWGRKGFYHCTQTSYLLRIMLVKSGLFKDKDILIKHTNTWLIVPHQYLQVKVGKEFIDVDVYAAGYGIPFGDHSHHFHTGLFPKRSKKAAWWKFW